MRALDRTRFVIIGGGECGARAAMALREIASTAQITLVGEEHHAPYERPPLSKRVLSDPDVHGAPLVLSRERAVELGIELVLGDRAVAIEPSNGYAALTSGRRVEFDRLLIATGARPRALDLPGGNHVRMLRTLDDAHALRDGLRAGAHLVVIGAGLIGLEVASVARTRGCRVSVLEAAANPLSRAVPPDVAQIIVKRHLEAGVDIRCGVAVDGIHKVDHGFTVTFGDVPGGIDADIVVGGIGATPNVELAADAGFAIENGIAVDAQLRTSTPNVFAAGDCCSAPHPLFGGRRIRIESWRNAHDQAVIAAANMAGASQVHEAVPWFWSDQYELGLHVAGLPQFAVKEVVRERADGSALRFGLDADGRVVSAAGVARGTSMSRDIRLAERLIASRSRPDHAALADAGTPLKSLLTA